VQSPLAAALSVHDCHHNSNGLVHDYFPDYFHNVGQPHEHDEIAAEKF